MDLPVLMKLITRMVINCNMEVLVKKDEGGNLNEANARSGLGARQVALTRAGSHTGDRAGQPPQQGSHLAEPRPFRCALLSPTRQQPTSFRAMD